MKPSLGTLAAIGALSLAVWTAFALFMPATPLSPAETVIVVGACGAVVLAGKWALERFRSRRRSAGGG